MNSVPNTPDDMLLRANDEVGRPIFALATLAYGVTFVVAGVGLWEGRNAPTLLSSAALAVGLLAMAVSVLGLVAERWRRVAAAASLPAVAFTVLGVVGLVGATTVPGAAGLDLSQMAWAMTLGMFSVMWGGTVLLAHASGEQALVAESVRSDATPSSRPANESPSSADLAA